MRLPKIKFSKWVKWSERSKIDNSNFPGVYLLAKFKRVPKEHASPLDKNILYIGETCKNTLKGRWKQFNSSACYNKDGHSGGFTYYKKYKGNVKDLFVSALPVMNLNEGLIHLFIRYTERKLLLNYGLRYGKQPECNRK